MEKDTWEKHVEKSTWRKARREKHWEKSTWTWRKALGEKHVEKSAWRKARGNYLESSVVEGGQDGDCGVNVLELSQQNVVVVGVHVGVDPAEKLG